MNRRQRRAKHDRAVEHGHKQARRRRKALKECRALIMAKIKFAPPPMEELMYKRGYVHAGEGKWHRLPQKDRKSISKGK